MDAEANMLLSRSCVALSQLSWLMYEAAKTPNTARKGCLDKFISEFKKSVDAMRNIHILTSEDQELCTRLEIGPQNLPDLFVSLYWYDELKKLYDERDPSVCVLFSRDHNASASVVSPGLDSSGSDRTSVLWNQSSWQSRITECVQNVTMISESIETGHSSTKRQFLSKSFKTTLENNRHRQQPHWGNDVKLGRLAAVVKLERLTHREIVLLSGKPASSSSDSSSTPSSSPSSFSRKRSRKG